MPAPHTALETADPPPLETTATASIPKPSLNEREARVRRLIENQRRAFAHALDQVCVVTMLFAISETPPELDTVIELRQAFALAYGGLCGVLSRAMIEAGAPPERVP